MQLGGCEPKETKIIMYKKSMLALAMLSAILFNGCQSNGPAPETVAYVDLERYVGLWYEIASNPVFFNKNLTAVTAQYAPLGGNKISVLNTGYVGSPTGRKRTISGKAEVVDAASNAKLKVQFDTFFGLLFRGDYWIVLLDEEDYSYAVVTDSRQFTLFILSRTPEMSREQYDKILDELRAKQVNVSKLRVTATVR